MWQQLSKQYGSSYRYYYNTGCGNSQASSLAVHTGIIIIQGVVTVKQAVSVLAGIIVIQGVATVKQAVWQFLQVLL